MPGATVPRVSPDPEDMLAQIDAATRRLLETVRAFTDEDVRAPSLLPGWTRGHVLAHLAGGAGAIRNLMEGVRTGVPGVAYASQEARDEAIEAGARRDVGSLVADVTEAAERFRKSATSMPPDGWEREVRVLTGAPFPAAQLLERRLVELVLHHTDLDAGYTVADWPRFFLDLELGEPMRTQREERVVAGSG